LRKCLPIGQLPVVVSRFLLGFTFTLHVLRAE
jgi:hypothetical protein